MDYGQMGPADMAAIFHNNGNNNDGYGFGGGGILWWILIMFFFCIGGWGNGFGGFGGGYGANAMADMYPWMNQQNQMSDGFRDQMIASKIDNIQNGMTTGFGDVQTALCGGFGTVNSNIANGFAQAEISANGRQMANMNQLFSMQTAFSGQLNGIGMELQRNGYENRAATADLKYTVANEACADRAAIDGALRDVTAQGVANTTALMNTINGGIQAIKDQLCNDKIDAKNERIQELQQQLYMKDLAASNAAQNALISQGFANEVDALYNRLNSCPVPTTPVYGRTPIFTCGGNNPTNPGCPCGYNM